MKKMKIALLAPAGAMHRYNGSFGHTLHYAPLTLTTLAALVPREIDADVVIYDETANAIPLDLDADIVGITCITGTAGRCYAYAQYFRSRGITVVMGGVHPTLLPDEALRHADAVMCGFSEYTFPQMLLDFQAGRLQKKYVQGGDFRLDGKPIPRRELLNRKKYITDKSVEAVRGCSLPCNFCAYPAAFGKTVYKRPVREVIEEIEALNAKLILFPDVNLIADRAYALELFSALAPLKKMWLGLATSHVGIDSELIAAFAKSGCRGLLIGLESISQGALSFVRKGGNHAARYAELMERLHAAGIIVQGCFAFGADDEDKSVFERTVEMTVKTQIDLPRYSILTPFPRTELYARLEEQGRIVERDWAMYDVEHCVFAPAQMSKEELERGIEWAWRETYKFSSIAKRLAPFTRGAWLSLPVNLGYKTYADKFARFTKEVMCDNSDIPQPAVLPSVAAVNL
ncbi:MAG: B12-binding domain-containing radical SAM protein [Gracilibacteraceae bacterium]|jgi:radical SAM superfamily enzyme YgiQ (UPF0313 family)|nr:B12-binding domain-containing radical SAM protein [Gracilibacteraceae bacterium]